MKKIHSEMKALEWSQHFYHYESMGIFSNAQGQQTPQSPVILLPAHPESFAHKFVSGMQSFYFSESQDAIVLQTCH